MLGIGSDRKCSLLRKTFRLFSWGGGEFVLFFFVGISIVWSYTCSHPPPARALADVKKGVGNLFNVGEGMP